MLKAKRFLRSSKKWITLATVAASVFSFAFILLSAKAAPVDMERVNVSNAGTEANAGSNDGRTSISQDGRYVAFVSSASNLVPDDTNGFDDVFVYDRQTDEIERISVSSAGVEGNGNSSQPSISADGRYVAFSSSANNITGFDTNGMIDIFYHDRSAKSTSRITSANGNSTRPVMAGNGNFIAFESEGTNVVAGDTNGVKDIFIRQININFTTRVSLATGGTQANGVSDRAVVSYDGRYVGFRSAATNLVAGDTNAVEDIFVRDRTGATTERVSITDGETEADGASNDPAISYDGRYVAFNSESTNLVSGDTNAASDVFVRDRTGATTVRVSLDEDGNEIPNDSFAYYEHYMSWDSRFVAFETDAANVVGAYTGYNVYLRDTTDATTDIVSINPDGTQPNGDSYGGSISASGQYVSMPSAATNFGVTDTNGFEDIYLATVFDNASPTEAISLSPSAGSETSDTTPTLDFTLDDPDGGDFVRYRIQIDNDSNFRSPIVDYTSALAGQGSTSFTVGQAAGSGTYTTGTAGQTLSVGYYFWRVLTEDEYLAESEWERATINTPAFVVSNTTYSDDISRISQLSGDYTASGLISGQQSQISADGNFIVFQTNQSTDYYPYDAFANQEILVYNVQTGEIEPVVVSNDGYHGDGFTAENPHISADGRYVVFISDSTNLVDHQWPVEGDQVYLYDRDTDTIELVSKNEDGEPDNCAPWAPRISGDGRYVTFTSCGDNLVPDDTNDVDDLFFVDLENDTIERINLTSLGDEADDNAYDAHISADGRYVAFSSSASNLGPGGLDFRTHIFVYDRQDDSIDLVDVSSDEVMSNGGSERPYVSGDGRYILFESVGTNLVAGDTNGFQDVFLRDTVLGTTVRVSVAHDGSQPNQQSGEAVFGRNMISDDGRYVVYMSFASNLVPTDPNGTSADIFLYDTTTGDVTMLSGSRTARDAYEPSMTPDGQFITFSDSATTLVENDLNGTYDVFLYDRTGVEDMIAVSVVERTFGGNGNSEGYRTALSDNGRYTVFSSAATNLVAGDTNASRDVFVYDSQTGELELISQSLAGVIGDDDSFDGDISGDGRYVTFYSSATNLIPGGTNGSDHIFVVDRNTGTVELVSLDDLGTEGNGDSMEPVISDDGRYVAFTSLADNLVAGDTNALDDVFVYDRDTDTIERVSVNDGGVEGDAGSLEAAISADGRYVAFASNATNLVAGDTNGTSDIFVYDRDTDTIERVSVVTGGVEATGGHSEYPSISSDGRYVVFSSLATNLVAGDTNGDYDVFVHDRQTGTTEIVSINDDGDEGDGFSFSVGNAISDDGRYVTFFSEATNLVDDDNNGVDDVFVYDRDLDTIQRLTDMLGATENNNDMNYPAISDDGVMIAFDSTATNLVQNDTEARKDVFLAQIGVGAPVNSDPDTPTSLGPAGVVDGSSSNDTTPTFTFDLSDDDGADTVQFRIQIDDTADFSSPIVDYTSALAAQGGATFTVGQAAGGGTYTTGTAGQTLAEGASFYWRVKAIDNSAAESAYATANGGAIAFETDAPAPGGGGGGGGGGSSGGFIPPTPVPVPVPMPPPAPVTPQPTPTPTPQPTPPPQRPVVPPTPNPPVTPTPVPVPVLTPTPVPPPVPAPVACTTTDREFIVQEIHTVYQRSKEEIHRTFKAEMDAAHDKWKAAIEATNQMKNPEKKIAKDLAHDIFKQEQDAALAKKKQREQRAETIYILAIEEVESDCVLPFPIPDPLPAEEVEPPPAPVTPSETPAPVPTPTPSEEPTSPGETPTPTPIVPGQTEDPEDREDPSETPEETPTPTPDGTQNPPAPYPVEYYYEGGGSVNSAVTNIIDNIRDFFTNTGDDLETIYLGNAGPRTQEVLNAPGETLSRIPYAPTIVTALHPIGTLAFASLLSSSQPAINVATSVATFSDLWLIISREFSRLLAVFGLKKKRKYWGMVYDSENKQPLDPAIVELIDAKTGKVLEESITDLWGKFGFLATEGEFILRARKSHYVFPSRELAGEKTDQIYDNLYFGEVIKIDNVSELVAPNIPMDPIAYDFNQEAKRKYISFHPKFQWWSYQLIKSLFLVGAAISFFTFLSAPTWFNGFITGIYVLFILRKLLTRQPRLYGRLLNSVGQPVAGLKLVLVPYGMPSIIAGKTVTSAADGKFFIKSTKGRYYLTVMSEEQPIHKEIVEITDEATLNKDVVI